MKQQTEKKKEYEASKKNEKNWEPEKSSSIQFYNETTLVNVYEYGPHANFYLTK